MFCVYRGLLVTWFSRWKWWNFDHRGWVSRGIDFLPWWQETWVYTYTSLIQGTRLPWRADPERRWACKQGSPADRRCWGCPAGSWCSCASPDFSTEPQSQESSRLYPSRRWQCRVRLPSPACSRGAQGSRDLTNLPLCQTDQKYYPHYCNPALWPALPAAPLVPYLRE